MYNKVMWATDGSEAPDRALDYANPLVADSESPLLVVYCEELAAVPPRPMPSVGR